MIPSVEELLGDEAMRLACIREFGIDIPEGATKIRVHGIKWKTKGTVEKWVPDEPYSYGLFSRRNPVYTKVEEAIVVGQRLVTWWVDGHRYGTLVEVG